MAPNDAFSLARFEWLVCGGAPEQAASEMFRLLAHLDAKHGGLSDLGIAPTGDGGAELRDSHYATRIGAVIGWLFSRQDFQLRKVGFERLIALQRWLTIIFGASPLGTADHVIQLFDAARHDQRNQITLTEGNLVKFALLYSLDSAIPLQAETLWDKDRRLAAALFFALLSSRIVATVEAHAKREYLLEWLPARLPEVSLDDIPLAIVHDVWMHCSYAWGGRKHSIKRSINELVRAKLLATGFADVAPSNHSRALPVLLCILEWFQSGHAMYRTYSVAVEALKAKFRVVGISLRGATDDVSRSIFDEIHVLPNQCGVFESVRRVCDIAAELKPDVVYYPSVGMFPDTVLLANLRIGPLQVISLGHPATTNSPFVDYAVVDEDYLGEPGCFSERLLVVAPGAIPYRPPANCPTITPKVRPEPDPVRIAVPASVMKVNPLLLEALRRVATSAKVSVEFRFFALAAFGLTKIYLENVVRRVLGRSAVVYPQTDYAEYLQNINDCDMFVNPFPFGNTNGIVDTVRQGLPGVCLTGDEVHSRVDEGLFRRLGLPEWLITRTIDEYVNAAVRLAENTSEREAIAHTLLERNPDSILFHGEGHRFADAMTWLYVNDRDFRSSGRQVFRPPSS